jgi:signal transduction histidine kinase
MVAVLAVALGWLGSNLLIVRPLRALVNCSSRVAAGDLTVRTGLPHSHDELGRLMLTFDQMAEALEQREIERKRNSHKLQTLSQKLVEIQETERRHIARELHDEIGQSLTLAEMNLQAALRTAGQPALARRLQASVQAVERVLEQVQDLSLNLRPSLLDDLGLGPTLQWYTSRHAGLAGLQTRLLLEPLENRLDSMIETECFRIMQEALTNIVRHAKARTVTIELTQEDGLLHLSVRDDGVGFQVGPVREEAQRGASLGLLSMEERATLAGGRLELESTPGEGTRVDAWFPLKWRPQVLSE